MKRQKCIQADATSTRNHTTTRKVKKNLKRVNRKEKEDRELGKVVEEKRDVQECEGKGIEDIEYWDDWSCSWNINAVDEQMPWCTCWCPLWGLEFIAEAYNALYNDVMWEDDIWDLKGIKDVPTP